MMAQPYQNDITNLRERVSRIEGDQINLKEDVRELTAVIAGLKESIDRGRGILYAASSISGGVGAAVASLFHWGVK
jgi:hypothetical protein